MWYKSIKEKKVVLFVFLAISLIFVQCNRIIGPDRNAPLNTGLNHIEIEYQNLNRELIVHLPSSYQEESIYPVVFVFHGLNRTSSFGTITMGTLVDSKNFIGIYPQGISNSWNTGYREVPSTADDVGFTLEILDWLQERINIDEDRLYTVGYSNGGTFSYRLALETDKFAAIASLSASFFEGQSINPGVPKLSIFQIHGELDRVVPYNGGPSNSLIVSFESALYTMALWANHNEIADSLEIYSPEERVTAYRYRNEAKPFEVLLYCLRDTTHNITLHPLVGDKRIYSVIWEFFERHSKNDR